ncbi:MAG: hypothetical protein IJT03_00350 [Clostridia bacterium]|nr:hypothetical protein [Clostridia bacterium]
MKKKTLNRIPIIPKAHQITWWVCRGLLFLWGVVMLFTGYTTEFLEAMFAIIFTHLWDLFQLLGGKTFITLVPYRIQTMLNVFICFGVVVGTTVNKFTSFEYIDIPEHFMAGFIATSGSYDLAVIIQGKQPKDKRISPALAAMFSLAFGVMLMVGWEFYEFTMDRLYGLNLQCSHFNSENGLIDTMTDMILGSAGCVVGMFVTAFGKNSVQNKDKRGKNEK